jgi:hypothetical protein
MSLDTAKPVVLSFGAGARPIAQELCDSLASVGGLYGVLDDWTEPLTGESEQRLELQIATSLGVLVFVGPEGAGPWSAGGSRAKMLDATSSVSGPRLIALFTQESSIGVPMFLFLRAAQLVAYGGKDDRRALQVIVESLNGFLRGRPHVLRRPGAETVHTGNIHYQHDTGELLRTLTVRERLSPLYNRYNAGLLGIMMGDLQFRAGIDQYDVVRARIHRFLRDLDISLQLPATHAGYRHESNERIERLLGKLGALSEELRDFFFLFYQVSTLIVSWKLDALGQFPAPATAGGRTREEIDAPVKGRVFALMSKYGIDTRACDELLSGLNAKGEDLFLGGQAPLSGAYSLLETSLENLELERDTAFVAMPFRDPFESRLEQLYRPLLESIGARVIVAWGGVDIAEYQGLMEAVIKRSGIMLADLTDVNPNVVYELGLFTGAECGFSYIAVDTNFGVDRLFWNIGHRAVLRYEPKSASWPIDEIQRLQRHLEEAEPMVAMTRARRRPTA